MQPFCITQPDGRAFVTESPVLAFLAKDIRVLSAEC